MNSRFSQVRGYIFMWPRRAGASLCLITAFSAACATACAAHAQVVSPVIPFRSPRHADIPSTPAQALVNVKFAAARSSGEALSALDAHYPKDSVRAVTAARARGWLDTLQRTFPQTPLRGWQRDPYAVLAVAANNDSLAQHSIATRLATPSLSATDRAYTLYLGVSLFASPERLRGERLLVAEQYLRQLDALGVAAAYWQFSARMALIAPYYTLGRSADVIRVGTEAFALVGRLPFVLREQSMYRPQISVDYAAVIDALGGTPDGRARIRAVNAGLLAAALPSAADVARDSSVRYIGDRNLQFMRMQAAMAERVGERGTPLVANYWLNRGATRDSQTVAVTDGKIRVLEIGSWMCPPCVAGIAGLERLHRRYPAVEFNFLTWGEGVWGNRVISPETEAVRLAEHFVTKLGATFPVGIALANRLVPTEDGGHTTTRSTPTWQDGQYPQASKPTLYILDGHGTIRHVIGGYVRDLDEHIASVITFLQQEAQQQAQQPPQQHVGQGSLQQLTVSPSP